MERNIRPAKSKATRRCVLMAGAAATMSTAIALAPGAAQAEVETTTVAYQYGITYLPLLIMRNQEMIEKHAAEMGMDALEVDWNTYSSGAAMNDALISGNLHFAATGTPPLITIWDRTRENLDVRGVAAFSALPQYLVTRNPDVETIEDFTSEDRIALPAVGVSLQATELQMAAAQVWGPENYDRLDDITVSMSHPDGMVALLSGSSEITAHFTNPPFQYQALAEDNIRMVLSSFDVMGGPVTNGIIAATDVFREENPTVYAAFLAALDESMDFIAENPEQSAEIYLEESGSTLELDFVLEMLGREDTVFSSTPTRTMVFADFMADIGRIDNRPEDWRALYFPEIHDRDGS
ncbi:MAG: ABC-type taurine uptake system substrate-binding component TauA [Rhodobacteraceae bacterium HLUCCA12]|nr:MAG: ABC-type taurine uptake system substrate-binding component TauA [Rhodobacteraceae bacterium HLUCCA12]